MLGTADADAGLEGKGGNAAESSRVQAVVSFFGPTDFATKTWNKQVEDFFLIPFLGGPYETKKEAYRRASPLQYVTKDDPPFLFIHGAKDTLVGIDNSEKMVKRLQEVGVNARLVTLPDEGHGWGGADDAYPGANGPILRGDATQVKTTQLDQGTASAAILLPLMQTLLAFGMAARYSSPTVAIGRTWTTSYSRTR